MLKQSMISNLGLRQFRHLFHSSAGCKTLKTTCIAIPLIIHVVCQLMYRCVCMRSYIEVVSVFINALFSQY